MSDADEKEPAKPVEVWPRVIKLSVPIEWGEQKPPIEALTFRRGRASDLKGIKIVAGQLALDDQLLIASRMCGVLPAVIDRLDVDDVGEVLDIALTFFGKCLRTGNAPSPS